jgi:hypothetical protein
MTEYGDIFNYQQSAIGFEALTLFFMVAYGAVVVWVSAHIADPAVESLRASLHVRG